MKAALVAVLLVGCAKGYNDQIPFPCPLDGVCPSQRGFHDPGSELACIDGFCVHPTTCMAAPPGQSPTPACPPPGQPGQTRCTFIVTQSGHAQSTCVTPHGSGTSGAACQVHLGPESEVFRYPVMADSECAPGYLCYSPLFEAAVPGACRKFCLAPRDCGAGEACIFVGGYANICAPTCDPFGAPCPTGQSCIVIDSNASGLRPPTICGIAGTAAASESCSSLPAVAGNAPVLCAPPLQCGPAGLSGGAAGRCRPICRTTAECPSGTTCIFGGTCGSEYCFCA